MLHFNRASEDRRQDLSQGRTGTCCGIEFLRRVGDQSSALRADGGEHFRMRESKPQRAVASHGDAADRATASPSLDAVFGFDEGDKLLQKKVVVPGCIFGGVDVEGASAFRGDNQKLSYLFLLSQILYQRPSPP